MDYNQNKERLLELIKEVAYQRGEFVLASGKKSDFYIDARKVTLHPEGSFLIGSLIFELIRSEGIDAVGGLTLGADPIVSSIALISHIHEAPISPFIVRKEVKRHGTQKAIEGRPLKEKDRVILVDDVLTTGGSLKEAAEKILPLGVSIEKIICVVDRREKENRIPLDFSGVKVPVESLFLIEEIHSIS